MKESKRKKEENQKSSNRQTRSTIDKPIDFQELHDAALVCSMTYKSVNVIKDTYGIQTAVGEDQEKNIRYFIIPPKAGQIIIALGGVPNDTVVSHMQLEVQFGLEKIVSQIEQNHFQKSSKKEVISIFAHSFGASVALLLAQRLLSLGFKIDKFFTFGQPKTLRETESIAYKNLGILRVLDYHDPYFNLFPGYVHVGAEVILLDENNYQFCQNHTDEKDFESSPEMNHVENYIRSLKYKLKSPNLVDNKKIKKSTS